MNRILLNDIMNTIKNNRKLLIVIGVVMLSVAVIITVLALNDSQDIRQRAASNDGPQISDVNQQQSPTVVIQDTNATTPAPTTTQELYTAPNDTEQPTVALNNMDNGAQVSANTQQELSATANDDIGVGNVEFLINGTLICSSASPYTCNWTVPAESNVQYVLTVRAYDLTGNVSTKSIVVNAQ